MKKLLTIAMTMATLALAAPDPNFHIYIAYGQSNMAGTGDIRSGIDNVEHSRYKMFATTACASLNRPTVGEVYAAMPPMFHCGEGLSIADWFGRYMADSLPGITIGIIPVAVGGTSIKLFDQDQYASYLSTAASYLVNWAKDYGSDGNASARIIEIGKKAKEVGVIKGIIFHQGETDGGMSNWETIVKKTRDDILKALDLSADTVPFLAGEMLDTDNGGCCYTFALNHVNNLPNVMENTYVVKSTGLSGNGKDSYHFGSAAYQEFGLRYAQVMLEHANLKPVNPEPQTPFLAAASVIPGKIEMENFDIPGVGTGNDSYNESDSENHGDSDYRSGTGVDLYKKATGIIVGYNQEGEWLEYTVNIQTAGKYTMFAAVASANATSSFKLLLDGDDITDNIAVPKNEGDDNYDDYNKVSTTLNLPSGEHILRFTVTGSWMDIDYITFVLGENATDPEPINGSIASIGENGEIGGTSSIADKYKVRFDLNAKNTYKVYNMSGKCVGTINLNGRTPKEALRAQGFKNNAFMLR